MRLWCFWRTGLDWTSVQAGCEHLPTYLPIYLCLYVLFSFWGLLTGAHLMCWLAWVFGAGKGGEKCFHLVGGGPTSDYYSWMELEVCVDSFDLAV